MKITTPAQWFTTGVCVWMARRKETFILDENDIRSQLVALAPLYPISYMNLKSCKTIKISLCFKFTY